MTQDSKFHIRDLRQHCRELFDVKPEVFDGAFALEMEENFTKAKARKKIKAFLKKEVK